MIPGGQHLPSDLLLGVCTVADAAKMPAGTAWFGHPPFELPRREVVTYDRRFTDEPSFVRYVVRVFWELMRFAVPLAPAVVIALWFKGLVEANRLLTTPAFLFIGLPLLNAGAATLLALIVVAAKWTMLGKVKPGIG